VPPLLSERRHCFLTTSPKILCRMDERVREEIQDRLAELERLYTTIGRVVKPPVKRVNRSSKPTGPGKASAARPGTKTAKILALLRRPSGATLKELCKATGWQAHSVRGFLSGSLKKKMGLRVDSEPRDDGQRAYRLASK
jgi:hypothetical protein